MWPDGWTAVTADGKRSAQFEHTLLVSSFLFSPESYYSVYMSNNLVIFCSVLPSKTMSWGAESDNKLEKIIIILNFGWNFQERYGNI